MKLSATSKHLGVTATMLGIVSKAEKIITVVSNIRVILLSGPRFSMDRNVLNKYIIIFSRDGNSFKYKFRNHFLHGFRKYTDI